MDKEELKFKFLEIIVIIHTTGGSILFGVFAISDDIKTITSSPAIIILFGLSILFFINGFFLFKRFLQPKGKNLDEEILNRAFYNAMWMLSFLIIVNLLIRLQ